MSRYSDLTFNSGEYIPQYAGLPLETIQNTGNILQDRHYSNLARLNQVQLLGRQVLSKVLPGAKQDVESQLTGVNQTLEELAKTGGENSTAVVNALANDFLGNQAVLAATQKAQEYEQFKKIRDSLTAQGLDPIWNKGLEKQYLESSVIDPETKQVSQLYSNPFNLTAERRLDYMKRQDEVLDPLKPDAWETDLKEAARMAGMPVATFLKTTKFQGLTSKKVQDYLFKPVTGPNGKTVQGLGWTSYIDTPEYRQQKMSGMTDDQIRTELQSRGEAKVFSMYDTQYMTDPLADDIYRQVGKRPNYQNPTLAPGKVIKMEEEVPYNLEGIDKNWKADKAPTGGRYFEESVYSDKTPDQKPTKPHPQYVEDLKVAEEVFGKKGLDPMSSEARGLVQQYNKYVEKRVYNSWAHPIPHDVSIDMSDELQRQYALRQYMTQDGKVVDALGPDSKMTEEFKKLTGGEPSKFKVESIYDPKNHFATSIGSNENFIQPMGVVATDEDGKTYRFLASQQPGGFNITPEAINTNKIYSATNIKPGKFIELGNGIKAKALFGKQLEEIDGESVAGSTYPIVASVPGINNGKELLYNSAEHLANILARPEEYGLDIKPIILNLK